MLACVLLPIPLLVLWALFGKFLYLRIHEELQLLQLK